MTPQLGLAYAVIDPLGLTSEALLYTVTDGSDDPGADPEIDGILFGAWSDEGEVLELVFGAWSGVADQFEPDLRTWSG